MHLPLHRPASLSKGKHAEQCVAGGTQPYTQLARGRSTTPGHTNNTVAPPRRIVKTNTAMETVTATETEADDLAQRVAQVCCWWVFCGGVY